MFERKTLIISNILFNLLLSIPIFYIVENQIFKLHDKLNYDEVPCFHTIILQLILGHIIQDFFFYFIHRILHMKYLYPIHKKHHEYKRTFSLLAYYVHPLEIFVTHFSYLGNLYIVFNNY